MEGKGGAEGECVGLGAWIGKWGGSAPFISPGVLWRGKGEGECVGLVGWIGKGGRGGWLPALNLYEMETPLGQVPDPRPVSTRASRQSRQRRRMALISHSRRWPGRPGAHVLTRGQAACPPGPPLSSRAPYTRAPGGARPDSWSGCVSPVPPLVSSPSPGRPGAHVLTHGQAACPPCHRWCRRHHPGARGRTS